jgi:glycine cleavage system regulatory protein
MKKEMAPIGKNKSDNPPIDVITTLESNLYDKKALVTGIQEYVEDVEKVSKQMKGMGLMSGNMYVYVSAQSAIDIVKDVLDLIDGKKITTLAEMEIELKKAREEAEKVLKGSAQAAYTG